MNAYLHASNLAHIPEQIAWDAAQTGGTGTQGQECLSSQECQRLSLCR